MGDKQLSEVSHYLQLIDMKPPRGVIQVGAPDLAYFLTEKLYKACLHHAPSALPIVTRISDRFDTSRSPSVNKRVALRHLSPERTSDHVTSNESKRQDFYAMLRFGRDQDINEFIRRLVEQFVSVYEQCLKCENPQEELRILTEWSVNLNSTVH